VKFFAELFYKKGLSRRHDWVTCNLSVECRKASRFFCQAFLDKKGLSRRHCGVCVTFRKGGESPVKFLPSFFSKKRVFGYFFQKVTLLIKTSLFVLMGKFPTEIFLFNEDSFYIE